MKFYLDFEATQFSERIISIGCIAANGRTFSSYVKPPKGDNVNSFITQLTGITKEMLEYAHSADEVFMEFYDFVNKCADGDLPQFYCYGDCDSRFIERTVNKMNNFNAIMFAEYIKHNLHDYHKVVQRFFQRSSGGLSLRNVYLFCANSEEAHWHDSLEDAKMLKYIEEHLNEKIPEEMKIEAAPKLKPQAAKMANKIGIPDYYEKEWGTKKEQCWEADTFATADNYKIKAISVSNEDCVKYFDSFDTAILWLVKFCYIKGVKISRISDRKKIEKAIIANAKRCYGFRWEIK